MKILKNVWAFVKGLFSKASQEVKDHVPTAIRIVEEFKKIKDGPVDDIVLSVVKAAIPGTADDIFIDTLSKAVDKALPIVLSSMYLIKEIAEIEDKNLQLQAILEIIKVSPENSQAMFFHNLCSMILVALSDGKLSIGEAFGISEYAWKNRFELKILPMAA
jgi:hypothetical protein